MARRSRRAAPQQNLLPAIHSSLGSLLIPQAPSHSLFSGSIGRGTVFWRIWPGVLFLSLFATGVVIISLETKFVLAVPPVLLTVLGMIIGFVISYRAMTGYDRYWMGRSSWSDIIRNTRTMARLVWHHVPPRFTSRSVVIAEDEIEIHRKRIRNEMRQIMAEKRMALDMIEGFSIALKHHLRGELGMYYEDLYHLIEPLHKHGKLGAQVLTPPPRKDKHPDPSYNMSEPTVVESSYHSHEPDSAVNSYGTFDGHPSDAHDTARSHSPTPSDSTHSDGPLRPEGLPYSHSRQHLLQPSMLKKDISVFSMVSANLVPFGTSFMYCLNSVKYLFKRRPVEDVHADNKPTDDSVKHRPKVAGGIHGQNMPTDILRCLSEWISVLEDRGCVPGAATGGMLGCIASFEDSLAALERILTTPLPFVYAVHIRHTVWVYLFFLPFQLLDQFGWYTIPGVAIAAFIYLGFLAAGEEIEQPFGYDENDLDLDLFCRVIIHDDLELLKHTPCFNSYAESDKGIAGAVAEMLRSDGPLDGDEYLGNL